MRLFKRPTKPKRGQKQYWYARISIDGKDVWVSSKCEVGKVLKDKAREQIEKRLRKKKESRPKSNVIIFRHQDKGEAVSPLVTTPPPARLSAHAPLSEVIKEFVNRRKINNLNSWQGCLYILNAFADYVAPETSIHDITVETIDGYKEAMKEKHKDTTINTSLSVLHKFFEDAKKIEKLIDPSEPNPVSLSGWITIKKENQEERVVYTDEEIAVLRDAAESHFLSWINLGLKTAARVTELWKGHKTHVHHSNENIWIPPSKSLDGRYVGLGPDGLEQVNNLITESPDGYLLRNSNGDRYKTARIVSERFKKLREHAGIKRGSFHSLRHTAATRMIQAGKTIEEVQYILGHKNILTTRIYIHHTEKAQKASLALDNL